MIIIIIDWFWAGGSGFDSWQELGMSVFSTMFRPALEPTQHPIQWVAGVKLTTHFFLVLRSRMHGTIPLPSFR
jgi:hypothetical protein